jgi:zeta-carotene isomerase
MVNFIYRVKSFFLSLLFIVLYSSYHEKSTKFFLSCEALSIVLRTTSDIISTTKGSVTRRSFPTIDSTAMQTQRQNRCFYDTLRLMTANPDETSIIPSTPAQVGGGGGLIGDDSAYFSLEEQRLQDWLTFVVATGTVLVTLSYLWFLPIGPHWGDTFLSWIQDSLIHSHDPAATIFTMLTVFAITHSGLASLRPSMEEVIGARPWRVIFACVSLPLALSCISYFVNHAHEGVQLWDLTSSTALHNLCLATNFVSFLLLYPSTFNLLEIAAVERPQLHLWETGVIRITRHPQAWGQILWCVAHTLWLGSSVALAASTVLVLHHIFSMWNGDRRLRDRHGTAFDQVQAKTSIVPFAAILDGRQRLPNDYYKELLRPPYLLVVGGTIAAYFAHPYMMAGAALLHW